jgi:hypothetical protein
MHISNRLWIWFLVLSILTLRTQCLSQRNQVGRVQRFISRIQLAATQESDDSGDVDVEEISGVTPDGEEQSANHNNNADELEEEARVFNPVLRLQCVQDYMEEADAVDDGFCPDYNVIARSGSGNVDNEVSLIDADQSSNQLNSNSYQNQDRAESIYLSLRTDLLNPLLGLSSSRYQIAYTSDVFDNTVDLIQNFNDLYGLSARYSEVHQILGIDDEVLPLAFGCEYYQGMDENIDEGPYCLVYHQIDAHYAIEGATLYFNTLIVNTTDYSNGQRDVIYRGFITLNNYFGISNSDLEGVDQEIPIEMVTNSTDIDINFNSEDPQFVFNILPNEQQIDIVILLRNLFTLEEIQIDAPKGLSSVRRLSVDFAHVGIQNGDTVAIRVRSTSPDFDFLSEHVGITNVNYRLNFQSNGDYESTFTGNTEIGSVTFNTTLRKTANDIGYIITLNDYQHQILSYSDISSTIVPTISTTDVELQPDDASGYVLDNLEIDEDSLNLSHPNITMSFQPYMRYTIEGFHDTEGDGTIDMYVRATYATIDGDMLIHYRYVFDYSQSQAIFNTAFEIEYSDAALESLIMTSLVFNTYNRDFNFSGYQEYSEVQNSTSSQWERGTNVTINAELTEH